jgi:hypothetical protein
MFNIFINIYTIVFLTLNSANSAPNQYTWIGGSQLHASSGILSLRHLPGECSTSFWPSPRNNVGYAFDEDNSIIYIYGGWGIARKLLY